MYLFSLIVDQLNKPTYYGYAGPNYKVKCNFFICFFSCVVVAYKYENMGYEMQWTIFVTAQVDLYLQL